MTVRSPCVAIVQARLGSTRLPMKSLLYLKTLPVIDWVLTRVRTARHLDGLVCAIADTPLDHVLGEHLRDLGVTTVVGDENDVLSRFVLAAQKAKARTIIRICADNPLVWGEAIDRLIEHARSHPCDYAYNHIPRNNLWPDGLGAELVTRDLLEEMHQRATLPSEREHCMNYIWNHPSSYRITTFDPVEEWLKRPSVKLDIDTAEDFANLALLPISHDMPMERLMALFPRTTASAETRG